MEIGLIQAALPALLRGLQMLMAVILCAVLWTGVHALAGALTPSAGAQPVPAPHPVAAGLPEPGDYAVIDRRNLFRPQGDPDPAPEPEPVEEVIEPTSLDLHLVGTMAGTDASLSVAVIQSGVRGAPEVVSVGDSVSGDQAKVVRIEQRRVVLDHGGRLEAIELDLEPGGASGRTQPGGAAATAGRPTPARRPATASPIDPRNPLAARGRDAELRQRRGELLRRNGARSLDVLRGGRPRPPLPPGVRRGRGAPAR